MIVILVIGGFVVNYFRNLDSGTTLPSGLNIEQESDGFPKTHKVAAGETLWSISEDYYGTGFDWTVIRDANEIENPSDLSEGMELTIPNIESSPKPETTENRFAVAEDSEKMEATPEPELAMEEEKAEPVKEKQNETMEETKALSHADSYTVVHGDSLWTIAVAQYGDGYKWVEIAKANHLSNPQIIHAGNVLILP